MADEVRYQMLRPGQIIERRKATPAAYIPLGTLEWHGPQNPVGSDTLQAEGLAIMAARKGGGLVFPPLYYGESRVEALMEANASDRERIAECMGLSPENFTPERHPFTAAEQTRNYQRLLLHILAEAESLGFAVGVLVAGHYPLIDHARAAVLVHNQRSRRTATPLLAWACLDYLLVRDKWPDGGDHAGIWETSHMLALHGDTVDLSALGPVGEPLVGIHTARPPQESTAEFGRRTLEAAAEVLAAEVAHRLGHPELYLPHGCSLREGLWRR